MSRPWKVRDTSPRNQSSLVSSTTVSMPPSASAAQGSRPLSGPTSTPPGVLMADAAAGRADARVDDRDVHRRRQVRHGLRQHGRSPGDVRRRHVVRDVDDPHVGRDPGDHAVTCGGEAVDDAVVGREADPSDSRPCPDGSRCTCRDKRGEHASVIFTEPQQGAGYDDLRRVARHAEAAGFDGFFRSDHYLQSMAPATACPARPTPGSPWPRWPCRPPGSGSARWSRRRRSGCPGRWRSASRQVDAMSGGRVELGLGGGWFEAEHTAYGIPFPPLGERFDRLEEQLEIITGLWTHAGRAAATPSPASTTRSIGLARHCRSRSSRRARRSSSAARARSAHPTLAARFADEFNTPFAALTESRRSTTGCAQACAERRTDRAAGVLVAR